MMRREKRRTGGKIKLQLNLAFAEGVELKRVCVHCGEHSEWYLKPDGYVQCRKCCRSRTSVWAKTNREHANAYNRRKYRDDPSWRERVLVECKKYRDRVGPPDRTEYYKTEVYKKCHRRSQGARRARLLSRNYNVTSKQWDDRWNFYGGLCWMCSKPAQHMDHVIPLVQGGPHIASNLRPACAPCNIRKGGRRAI